MEEGNAGRVLDVHIDEHLKSSYINYSMYVIKDRALPDGRDGLKPVHRRILFAMHKKGLKNSGRFVKSAQVIGETMGKYHPHGNAALYEAAVRMAQWFSLQHPLIDGHGNFGSTDNDPPAAERYTEMKMARIAEEFFGAIDSEAVDFEPTYDSADEEPTVLPVTFPHLWVNGTSGIAVGMATEIPTHNLTETINAFLAYMENPDITVRELMKHMPAPDFPTGGIVHDLDGYVSALETGRGSVKLRGVYHEEQGKRGTQLVITELPYRVCKSNVVIAIADMIREKKLLDVIGAPADESNDELGTRIVLNLAKGASADVVFNQIVAETQLEVSVPYNVVVLHGNQPVLIGIRESFGHFLDFRIDVVKRTHEFELRKAKHRMHILDGYLKAIGLLDETIKTIRAAADAAAAKDALCALLGVDEEQASEILALRLQKLTGLEIDGINEEKNGLVLRIADIEDFLSSRDRQLALIREAAIHIRDRYGIERRTSIGEGLSTLTREDLIEKEDVLIPITAGGYAKRIPVSTINRQNRGTRGKNWMATGDDDYVVAVHSASTHDYLLAFTDAGQVLAKKVHQVPEGAAGTKGRHVRNILDGLEGNVMNIMSVADFTDDLFLVTVSAMGNIKRTRLSEYANATRKGGIQAVRIEEGDSIVGVDVCREHDHIILVGSNGKAIRFTATEDQMRPMGRVSVGTRGIKMDAADRVVGMVVVRGEGVPCPTVSVEREGANGIEAVEEMDTRTMDYGRYLLCIGEKGVGKRTGLEEFKVQSRGGKGVTCFNINTKTGALIRAMGVSEDQDLVLISGNGISNRIHVGDIRVTGRAASGTILMNIDKGDRLVDTARVVRSDEPEETQESQ